LFLVLVEDQEGMRRRLEELTGMGRIQQAPVKGKMWGLGMGGGQAGRMGIGVRNRGWRGDQTWKHRRAKREDELGHGALVFDGDQEGHTDIEKAKGRQEIDGQIGAGGVKAADLDAGAATGLRGQAKGASGGGGDTSGGECSWVDGAFGVVKDRLGGQGKRVEEVEDVGSGMEPVEPQRDIGEAGLEFDVGIHPTQGGDGGGFGGRVEGRATARAAPIQGGAGRAVTPGKRECRDK
jgi:hypothetical protein